MFRRRVRSALYIDFENVPLPPETIASWLAWLEDGVFDPKGQRRRFIQKRVYWNANAEKHKETFRKHGFATILVGKYSGLKNGADIRMAMDLIETTYRRSEIDEYILLSGDSDFVPVLERLREKAKRTAMVATEHRPHIHTIYNEHADVLIPSRRLVEAAQYRRPPRTLVGRLLAARRIKLANEPTGKDSLPSTSPRRANRTARPAAANVTISGAGPPADPTVHTPIALAEARVVALVTAKPRNYVAQKRVLAELERVPGFKRTGGDSYLGCGSYKALMKELSRRNPMIKVVDQVGGGTGIIHVPKETLPYLPGEPGQFNGHAVTPGENGVLTRSAVDETDAKQVPNGVQPLNGVAGHSAAHAPARANPAGTPTAAPSPPPAPSPMPSGPQT